ncbi:RecE family exodeoxyribonuclease [Enterobacter ludwigii]|uniref:RecE family exodeoxyribonuclease n=1 Tax=Enterobacter ludwigii TaxID=299767 RepID=UPI003BEEE5F7
MSDMPQEFAHVQKVKNEAARKRLNIKALFFWCTAKKESLALSRMALAADEAGFNDEDFARPVRVNLPVVSDIPPEGVIDTTFCDRYEIGGEDGKTMMLIPGVAPLTPAAEKIVEGTDTTIIDGVDTETGEIVDEKTFSDPGTIGEINADLQLDEHDDEKTRYPVIRMSYRKRLLSQLTSEALRHSITRSEYEELVNLEKDTKNHYVQNLLLAAENCEEVKGYDTKDLWRYTDAIRKVFSLEKRHELALVLRFTRIWAATDYIDRGILVREWESGSRISGVQRTDSGTNADSGYITDRGEGAHHTLDTLDLEIACANLPMDFNPHAIPGSVLRRAKEIVAKKEEPWKSWSKILRNQPGVLSVNRIAIFNLRRIAPENIHLTPVAHLEFVNATMTEEFCRATELMPLLSSAPELLRKEVDRQLSAERGEFVPGISDPTDPKWDKTQLQPQVENLGGGVFSIDGLLNQTASNEDQKTEVENTESVQVQEINGNEEPAGDEMQPGENTLQPDEGGDDNGVEVAVVDNAAIIAAAAPTLANQEGGEADHSENFTQQNEPEAQQNAPETQLTQPVLEGEFIPKAEWPSYFEPGRYVGVPNDVYHAANGISSTMVKDARVSLMFYHGRHITKTIRRESSEALTFGSLVHTLGLEPEKFDAEYAVFPGVPADAFTTTDSLKSFIREFNADKPKADQLKLTGKKEELQEAVRAVNPDAIFADEFEQQWRESVDGKTILTSEQLTLATAIQQALLNHKSAGKLLRHPSRAVETSYFGIDDETGLEVRVRPDLEVEIDGVRIGVDLKTISMGRVKQDGLRAKLHREIIDRDYHVSAAMYCNVADFDQFFWIFVNKDPGYHWVAVIEASEDELDLGLLEYQKTMRVLAKAYDTDYWPAPVTEDYTDELNDFDKCRLDALREAAKMALEGE